MTTVRQKSQELHDWHLRESRKIGNLHRETREQAQAEYDKAIEEAQSKYFAIIDPIRKEMDDAYNALEDVFWAKMNALSGEECCVCPLCKDSTQGDKQ